MSRRVVAARVAILVLAATAMSYPYLHGNVPLDLHVYLAGGDALLHGDPLYGPHVSVQGYPFTYPPFAAYPFALLSAVPLWFAELVVALAFYVCLAVVIELCRPGLLARACTSWRSTGTVLLVFAVQPIWATLQDGQVNLLLAALVLIDLVRPVDAKGRGVLVGVAAAIKLTPAVFIVYLLLCREFRSARNASLSFVVVGALGFLFNRRDAADFWFRALLDTTRVGDGERVSNQSVSGFLLRATTSDSAAHVLWIVIGAAVAAAGLYVAVGLTRLGDRMFALGVVGVLGCLLSPISWTHHWVWVVPCFLGALGSTVVATRAARITLVVAAVVFLVGANKLGAIGRGVPVLGNVTGAAFVLTALTAIALAGVAMRRQRADHT